MDSNSRKPVMVMAIVSTLLAAGGVHLSPDVKVDGFDLKPQNPHCKRKW